MPSRQIGQGIGSVTHGGRDGHRFRCLPGRRRDLQYLVTNPTQGLVLVLAPGLTLQVVGDAQDLPPVEGFGPPRHQGNSLGARIGV